MLERPHLADAVGDFSAVVETPRNATLESVATQCDWVVADESSCVHLPVLKLGIPTVPVKGLGVYPPSRADMYGFVANGIILPPVTALRDVLPETVAQFFTNNWPARFAQYDAAYLRSEGHIAQDVRRAIESLLESTPAPASV
jgi:hypothetical protein